MMNVYLCPTAESLGVHAAFEAAEIIRDAISKDGTARIILSTGASQFTTLSALVEQPDIDWNKVEMFHLDEYMDLPDTHPASFRKYLKERFVDIVHPGKIHFVDGTKDCIEPLTKELRSAPIHLGLIGIGQNAHIAFNDPPADVDSKDAYLIVHLDSTCRSQQVQEGWFPTVDDVPKHALSMSVYQIMQCERIISAVPYECKASAVHKTLCNETTNLIPGTFLKSHPAFSLYVDHDSYGNVDPRSIILCGSEELRMTIYG